MSDYWIAVLLRDAQSGDLDKRLAAEEALGKLSEQDQWRAVDIVDLWIIRRERVAEWLSVLHPFMILSQLCWPIVFVFCFRQPLGAVVAFITWLVFMIASCAIAEFKTPRSMETRERLLRPLFVGDEYLDAARLIDSLGPHIYYPDAYAAGKLVSILPQLSKEGLSGISEQHRNRLYRILVLDNLYNQTELLSAVLDLAERTEDLCAYDNVKSLAGSPAVSPGAKRIRDSARKCLAVLEPLMQEARFRESLLRPSISPDSDSSLLRPARNVEDNDEILLRAAEPVVQHGTQDRCES